MAKTVAELRKERNSGKYNISGGNSVKKTKTVAELRKERDSGKYNIIIDKSVKKSQDYQEQVKQRKMQRVAQPEDFKSYVASIPYKWEGAVTPSDDMKARKSAFEYISRYNDTTTYDDIQNDIKDIEMHKAGAERRGEDTKQYDYVLNSIKLYKNNVLNSLDSNDVSIANRKAVYNEYTDKLKELKANRIKSENDIRNDDSLSHSEKVSKAQALNDEIFDLDALISAYERNHQKFIDDHYDFKNDPEFEKYAEMGANLSANLSEDQPRFTMSYLTDDEQKNYNYFLAKYGNDEAEQYYKYIENKLNKRTAEKRFEEEYEGRTGKELAHKVISGFDNFETGVGAVFNPNDSSYINPSYNKYLSALTREDLKDAGPVVFKGGDEDPTNDVSLGQVTGDLIETISNQAIPLVAGGMGGTAASTFGTALLGLSAGGSSYSDMINEGYNKKEASNYATLIGASESTLQYLLGGISKLSGGKTLSNVVTSKIKNGLLKASLSYGGNIASEFSEEALQEVLAPVFKGVVTGEKIEYANLDDVIYAGVLGALSAGVMESPNLVSDSVAGGADLAETSHKNKAVGNQIASQGNAEVAINKALNLPDTSSNAEIKKLAQEIQNTDTSKLSKPQVSKYNKKLGQLYDMLQKSSVSDVINSSDVAVKDVIKQKLTEYGVTEHTDDIASAIYKQFKGQETNYIDRGLIKANYGDEIITYLNDNKSEIGEAIASRINESYRNFDSVKGLLGIEEISDIDIEDFNLSDDGKTYIAGTSSAVEVRKIESISKEDIVVSLSDGSEQSVKNLDLGSSEQAVLYQGILDIQSDLGVKLDTSTANTLVSAFNGLNTEAKRYLMDAKVAIMKGYANVDVNTLKTNVLGDKARIIYDLGVKLSENETARRKKAVENKVAPKNKSTVTFEDVDRNNLTELQRVSVDAIEKVAEATGVNFVFFRSVKKNGKFTSKYDTKNGSPNGFYKASTNTVYLDINAGATGKGTILFTAGHELAHEIREWSPESFKTFADFLVEKYTAKGDSFDALVRAKMQKLGLTYDEAYEEVVADSCESFLVDSNLIENVEELSKRDMNLVNKIKDFLKNLLQKVREVYRKLNPDSYEGKYVREMSDSLSELHGKWIQGIKNATENLNNAKTDTTKNTANNDGVKFSISRTKNMSWEEQINEYFNKNSNVIRHSDTLVVMNNIPSYMSDDTINDLPIALPISIVTKAQKGKNSSHTVTEKNIKELQSGLETPIAAVYDESRNSMFVVTSIKQEGLPVCVALALNTKFDGDYVHKATSIHIRQEISNYFNNLVDTKIFVINKNELAVLCREVNILDRLQGNNELIEVIVPHNNNEVKKNSLRDTTYLEAVNNGDMDTAQRMVDETAKNAGYTIKAYHGTKSFGFTKFDLEEAREAKAIFLTDSQGIATSYSSLQGTREVSDAFTDSLDGMSAQQLVNELNKKEYVTSETPYIRYFLYNDMIVRDLFNGYIQTYIDVEQAKTDLIQKRSKGNYALYIKPDNMLTIDCKGAEYDEITGWNEENPKQKGTTDDVAKYAYEKGYDSVAMENLIDNGGLNENLKLGGEATIYAVFNPASLKSSDTITYDDNGDIIPLSKRFDMNNEDIRYSERIVDDAVNSFGTTYSWAETGYLLTDGRRLDFSGKKYGARPGSRSQDHREILDAYSEEEQDNMSGSEAMVDFMGKGNIRISPETDGINLSVLPTKAQEAKLSEFISRAHGEVILDIDDARGNTVVSVEYPYGTNASKVINDIRKYFEDGTEPYISETQMFRYQARPDFSDILFDEFDGEVTDNDARLITEYIDGNADTISHILDKTNSITLSESKVKSLVSRMLSSYDLSKDNQKAVYVATLSLLESTDRREVLDNLELLKTALTNTIQSSKLISEYDKSQKADVLEYLRDFRKEYSVYLNDEQLSSLEFQGRSVSWLKKELFPLVSIVKEDSDSSKKKMSFGYFWHNISEVFPDIFDMDHTDSVDNWEIFLEKLNRIKNPPTLTVEEAFGISEDELVNELTGRLVADAVEAKYNSRKNAYVDTLIKNLRKKHNENVHKERIRITQKIKDSEQKKYDRLVKEHKRQRETYTENRNKTAVRNKIRNKVKQLDSYLNHGNKKKNVKEDMRDFVSRALETADIIFSNDISNEDILRRGVVGMSEKEQKYYDKCRQYLQMRESQEEMYAKARDKSNLKAMQTIQGKIAETNKKLKYNQSQIRDLFAREKAKLYEIPVVDALNNLADEYSKIKESESSYVSNAYDEDVLAMINDLKGKIGKGTRAKDMTLEQLIKVHDVYTAVLSAVRNANKLFIIDNSVSDTGEYIYEELEKVKKARNSEGGSTRLIEKFGVDSLKPIYFFRMLGSKTFENLYWNLQKGELKWYQNVSLVKEFRKQMAEKYNYTSWDFESLETFTDVFGNEFSLSLEEKLSLCALWRREQGREHLLRDGFVFDENVKIKGDKKGINVARYHTDHKAHSMSVDIVMKIYGTLTEEQKAYMEDMQKYLSTDMSNLGNEVSMKLYGIKQFKEAFYFPIKVSRKHLNTDPGKTDVDAKLKSSGFTHNTVPKSGNPIVLSEFSTVWANHCNRMCQYNAFVLPLEDLTKVLNYRVSSANRGNSADSLKAEISGRWGNGAVQYLEKLIRDINGSVRNENIEIVDKLISLTKKGQVMLSASVTIQQPFAMYRALSLISPKYYPKAMAKGLSFKNHNSEFEELKKYAPVAGIKEMGYFDVGIGQKTTDWMLQDEYEDKKEKIKAFFTDSNYRDDILSIPPAKADEVAWLVIWRAVKSEMKDTTNLTGEEYLNRCGERFNEIIHLTQVYDSVLSRSGLMRNKDTTAKMVTAFMAEPTVTMNMLVDSVMQAERIGRTKGFKAATGRIVRVYSTIAFTQVITALFKSLVLAGRDDDEDETYIEKYISAASQEALQSINPIGWISLGRDVLSVIQGYDIERTDMSLISDFIDSIYDLSKTLSSDDSSGKEIAEDATAVISSFANFFGVPVKNFFRDIDTAVNIVKTFINSKDVDINSYDVKEAVVEGVWNRSTKKVERAKKAYDNGDMEVFHETISDMVQDKVDDGKTEKEARSSVRSKFTKQCKNEYLKLYVDAKNISEANEIRKYLLATGLYGSLSELDKDLIQLRKDYMKEKNNQ